MNENETPTTTSPLNETGQKWLEALRSDEWRQAHGTLRLSRPHASTYSYCCLGVLCEVAGWERAGSNEYIRPTDQKPMGGWIDTTDIADLIGVDIHTAGRILDGNPMENLRGVMEMNDTGSTFREIADAIEARVTK